MNDLQDTLGRLSDAFGVSGHEKAVRELIKREIAGYVDRMEVDGLGNLISYKQGVGPEPRLRVMVSGHMDEIGFMITRVESDGTLRFHGVGGVVARTLLAKRLVIGDSLVPGVIGAPPPHLQSPEQRKKVIDVDELRIDIGATDRKGAEAKVKVGDYATFDSHFCSLGSDPHWRTVRGKAFDDRAGCTVVIGLLQQQLPVDLIGVFTVQEEMGLRGARAAAYRLAPDAAIAVEGTICDDLPQDEDEDRTAVTRLGDGPAVTLMDRSLACHPGLLKLFRDTAQADGVPMQYKAPLLGSTDSGAIHLTREGVPTITAAVPSRYIHGPASILNIDDLHNTVRLIAGVLRRLRSEDLGRQ
jgi:tetrahedral aminopeptidase